MLAGEPSGDRLGADLLRRLIARVPLAFTGVGGDELTALGLKSLFPMSDLAVMGISDVVRRLPRLLWRIEQTARAIRKAKPDIVVLIDSQDFSRLLARRLKTLGYTGKLILYVAPTVWARAPERAARLKPLFDEVLAILPFEPAVMARLGGPPTSYVGHPALGEQRQADIPVSSGPLLLLPGSREGELHRHLPLFKDVVTALPQSLTVQGLVLPTLRTLRENLEQRTASWPLPVTIAADREQRQGHYSTAALAITVAGTATLELALARVPMVVSYVMDPHQSRVYDKLGRPLISLPNIILGRPVVPEIVQDKADAGALQATVQSLLEDTDGRAAQISAFNELARRMENGDPDHPRQDPADRILAHWSGV
jgi:lipid-A-disaccharide synthase